MLLPTPGIPVWSGIKFFPSQKYVAFPPIPSPVVCLFVCFFFLSGHCMGSDRLSCPIFIGKERGSFLSYFTTIRSSISTLKKSSPTASITAVGAN